VLYRGCEKPVGDHWHRGIAPHQCRLRGFWPHTRVRTVLTVQPREVPQGKLGVIRKAACHGGQSRLKPRDRNYFLHCSGGTYICPRDIGMDNSVTGNMDMLDSGYPAKSMTMLATVVSPACRRLRRVGVCHSYPGTCFFFCQRKHTTRLRGRFSRGSQVPIFDP